MDDKEKYQGKCIKRLQKAAKRFNKAFKILDKMELDDHHRERIPVIRVPLLDLMSKMIQDTLGMDGQ